MITRIFQREGLSIDGNLDIGGAFLKISIQLQGVPRQHAVLDYHETKNLLANLSIWLTEAQPQSERLQQFDMREDDVSRLISNPIAFALLPAVTIGSRSIQDLIEACQNAPYINVPTEDIMAAIDILVQVGLVTRKDDCILVTEKGHGLMNASFRQASNQMILARGQQN